MKTPLAIISNDWHIKSSNIEQMLDIAKQKCELATKMGISHAYILGDIFESRIAQRLDILRCFKYILDRFRNYGINLTIIPGNHDKTDYNSSYSFLSIFDNLPNIDLCSEYGWYNNGNIELYLIPFYNEEKWLEIYNGIELNSNAKNVLFTHVAFQGSVNNDGTEVSSPIKPLMFSKFDLVLSGHYHNYQQVEPNIYHLPSVVQHNFGENENKGFTILYDDLSFEIIKSNFRPYRKTVIDIDKISQKELMELTEIQNTEKCNIRFEFVGSETKIKSLSKNLFIERGIDVKCKFRELEVGDSVVEDEIKQYNMDSIKESFGDFCQENKLNYEEGVEFLKQNQI